MFACGQNVGVKDITCVIPTGIRTAENTRLKASNALSSRTRPVAFLTKRLRLLAGGGALALDPAVVTCILPTAGQWTGPTGITGGAQGTTRPHLGNYEAGRILLSRSLTGINIEMNGY